MGSHSVTCHPAVVTFPPLPQPKLVLDLATPEGHKAELIWVVVISEDSLPVTYLRNNHAVPWLAVNPTSVKSRCSNHDHRLVSEVCCGLSCCHCYDTSKRWICIALSRNNLSCKALRYDTYYTRVHTVLPATKHEPTCLNFLTTEHYHYFCPVVL